MFKKTLLVIAILLAIGVISFLGYRIYMSETRTKQRQAVFMTNGQVYFGYLSHPNSQSMTLQNIYYLKTQDLADNSTNANKKIVLVKLGNELHSPEDVMYINRDQVLFFQDIKADSKINDAINKFVQKSNDSNPTPEPSK